MGCARRPRPRPASAIPVFPRARPRSTALVTVCAPSTDRSGNWCSADPGRCTWRGVLRILESREQFVLQVDKEPDVILRGLGEYAVPQPADPAAALGRWQ